MGKELPCKNCSRRGCGAYHDICKEYQEVKAFNTAAAESAKAAKETSYQLANFRIEQVNKSLRRRGLAAR